VDVLVISGIFFDPFVNRMLCVLEPIVCRLQDRLSASSHCGFLLSRPIAFFFFFFISFFAHLMCLTCLFFLFPPLRSRCRGPSCSLRPGRMGVLTSRFRLISTRLVLSRTSTYLQPVLSAVHTHPCTYVFRSPWSIAPKPPVPIPTAHKSLMAAISRPDDRQDSQPGLHNIRLHYSLPSLSQVPFLLTPEATHSGVRASAAGSTG
jgi:hypothetical protein